MNKIKNNLVICVFVLTVIFHINTITVKCEEDEYYKSLPISVKQVNNNTVLDNEGKVWFLDRAGMEMGYRLHDPIEIPGMNNGILIGDKISLLSDGSIWSFEINCNEPIIEHKLAILPTNLQATEIKNIFRYNDYIFIIDNEGVCYYVYTYDKKVQMNYIGLEVTQLLGNVKDIGNGYILDNDDKLYKFDIVVENGKEELKLEFFKDNIIELVVENNICLDKEGVVYTLGTNNSTNIPNIPLMSKLFNTGNSAFFSVIGEDMEGNLIGIKYDLPVESVEYKRMIINDYEDIVGLGDRHIIVIENDNTTKSWFIYNQIGWDSWGFAFESFSPED